MWAKPIRVIDGETDEDYSTPSNATLHTLVAILNTFRQLDKKYKSKKKRNYDTLIRDTITVLATQGWQKCLDEEDCESETDLETEKVDPLEPIARLGVRFKIPLQAAGVDVDKLREEFYDMQRNF